MVHRRGHEVKIYFPSDELIQMSVGKKPQEKKKKS
jgi:hypothetical protein